MNVFELPGRIATIMAQHPLLERLLVASLELVVVTAVVLAIIRVARIKSNRVIALLWLVALTKPVLSLAAGAPAPIWNAGVLGIAPSASVADAGIARDVEWITESATVGSGALTAAIGHTAAKSVLPPVDPAKAAVGTWLVGVAIMALLSIADRLRIRRLVASASPPSRDIEALYRQAGGVRHKARLPKLLITDQLESPAIAGTFSPVVFLPAWMAENADRERIMWSLRHELTHWRHRDHLAGFLGEVSRVLFYFHPLVWWIGRRWKVTTEIACDQAMVTTRGDARRYAEQLYQILTRVHTRRQIMLANGLFATRTQIGKRIELLLKSSPAGRRGRAIPAAVFLALFAAMVFTLGVEISPAAGPGTTTIKAKDKDKKTTIEMVSDDDSKVTMVIEGVVEFDKDKGGIAAIAPGGSFEVTEKKDGVKRELVVKPGDGDELTYEYEVDGKSRPFDDKAREWLNDILGTMNVSGSTDLAFFGDSDYHFSHPVVVKKVGDDSFSIRIVGDGDKVDIYRDDSKGAYVELKDIDEGDFTRVWISTKKLSARVDDSRVTVKISNDGTTRIALTKDGVKHELEMVPGSAGRPDYIYKVDGEIRPYDDEAKKVFEKYIHLLENGIELNVKGERI